MAATVLVQQFALNTSTGNQDFTISGGGTCKGCIVKITRATTAGTEAATAVFAHAFIGTDGTTRCVSIQSEDAQSRTDSRSRQDTGSIWFHNATQSGVDADITWVSFITDGVRLNIADAPGSAWIAQITFFFGADINIEVGTLTTSATDSTEVLVTPGQETELLFLIRDASGTEDAVTNNALAHFAAAYETATPTIVQTGMRIIDRDNSNTTDQEGAYFEGEVDHNFGASTLGRYYTVSTMSATQIGITSNNNGDTGVARQFYWMSINFSGVVDTFIGTWDMPGTPTGNKSYTGAPFTPQWGMIVATQMAGEVAPSGSQDKTNPGGLYFQEFDGTRARSTGFHWEDGQADSDTGSFCNTKVQQYKDDGTNYREGTFSSFNSDGFTLNYTTLPAATDKGLVVLVQEESADTVINQTSSPTLTLTENNATVDYDVIVDQVASPTLTLSSNNATVDWDIIADQVAAGSLTLTPNNATVDYDVTIDQVASPALTLTPNNATVIYGITIDQVASPTLTLTPFNATVDYDVIVDQVTNGILTLSPFNADTNYHVIVDQPAGVFPTRTLTAFNIVEPIFTFTVDQVASPVLTLTPFNATVGVGEDTVIDQVASPTLTLTPNAATVNYDVIVDQVTNGILTLSPNNADVAFGVIVDQVASPVLTLATNAATVDYDVIVDQATNGILTLSPLNAGVVFGIVVDQVASPALVLTPNVATVSYDVIVDQVAAGSLTFSGFNATIVTEAVTSTATAILQPTEVPDEVLAGTYACGALAYHREGITSVKIKLTDSLAATLTVTPTSRSNFQKHFNVIWCYNASFDLSTLADGTVTVEITATPTTGADKVLTYTIYNNSGGSFKPVVRYCSPLGNDSWDGTARTRGNGSVGPKLTIHGGLRALAAHDSDIGGHFLLLEAGTYGGWSKQQPYVSTTRGWVTILPVPGLNKTDVTIRAGGNTSVRNASLVRWYDVTMKTTVLDSGNNQGHTTKVWLDFCYITDPRGIYDAGYKDFRWASTTGWDKIYATACLIEHTFDGASTTTMLRDCIMREQQGDLIRNPISAIINCTAFFHRLWRDPDTGKYSHGDSVQFLGTADNVVICGFRAFDTIGVQGLFFDNNATKYSNMAIENCLFQVNIDNPPITPSSRMSSPHEHVLLRHVTIAGQNMIAGSTSANDYTAKDCEISNCCFFLLFTAKPTFLDDVSEMLIRTNHYVSGNSHTAIFGTSIGDPKYVDKFSSTNPNNTWDYRPGTGSPLLANGTALDLPPGPKGVGTPATPNIGAWGDAAGKGFSHEGYVSGGPTNTASVAIDLPVLTLAAAANMGSLVSINLGFILDEMVWEGKKILQGFQAMTAPPGSPSDHYFAKHFHVTTDGRCLRIIIRVDSTAQYLDFWFFHHWGHTGTTRITWPQSATPGKITLGGVDFFQWGEGRSVRVNNHFAHGNFIADRIRLTFTDFKVWHTGKVINQAVETAALLPYDGHTPAPSWVGGPSASAAQKAATLAHQIRDMAPYVTGDDREHFVENEWIEDDPFQGGDQERFGLDHLGVEFWAGGNAREYSWWMVLRKHGAQLGNWVNPDGTWVDFTSAAYNKLNMDENGLRPDSSGFDEDPTKTGPTAQNWFNHKLWGGDQFQWMSRNPKTGNRYIWTRQQSYGSFIICQYYDRYKDPGAFEIIKCLLEKYIGTYNTDARGNNLHRVTNHRARGRGMQAAAAMYLVTSDARLLQVIKDRLQIELDYHVTNAIYQGSWNAGIGFASWMTGIWCAGMLAALHPSIPLAATMREQVESQCLLAARRVLLCWHEWPVSSGIYENAYTSDASGAPSGPQNTWATSLWLWGFASLMWLKHVKYSSLDSGEQAKLDIIYAQRFTAATGTTNEWPEKWEWFWWPVDNPTNTNTAAVAIDLPVITTAVQVYSTPATDNNTGAVAIDLPVITTAAVAIGSVVGSVDIDLPVITTEIEAFNTPATIEVTGYVDIDLPLITTAVVALEHVRGVVDISLPVPTTSITAAGVFFKLSQTQHIADGTETDFLIGFPYLHIDHVSVTVDGEDFPIDGTALQEDPAAGNLAFATPPSNGAVILIRRDTPHDKLFITFEDGAPIDPNALNRAILQPIYYAEEVDDQA